MDLRNLEFSILKYLLYLGKSGASKITEKGFENIPSKVACYVPEDEVIFYCRVASLQA